MGDQEAILYILDKLIAVILCSVEKSPRIDRETFGKLRVKILSQKEGSDK